MPSPTEQISTENFPLPLKDPVESVENVTEPPQKIDSHVDPEGGQVPATDNQVHEGQEQQGTASAASTTVADFATSPPHMTDTVIVNDGANVTTSTTSIASPNDDNMTSTTNMTQPTTKTTIVPNPGKRKYTKRLSKDTKEDPTRQRPSRRTRNTLKSTTTNDSTQVEQSPTLVRRTSNASESSPQASTTRRGTSSTIDVDLNVFDSSGRQLPSREGINESNISDRFVDFIMYCNPSAPDTLDKSALVRSFNAVPKSDGKVFQTWSLYQLVGKHYAGEIRTWTKLAQKLGVVRTPEASPQKIQQYAVRLKKWMASVHVDAYFDYLLVRSNEYYQTPQRNPTEASDDESDVVLKLIKRAGSKRQKRKYTRKSTNTSNTSINDNGVIHPEGASRETDTTELDDHFESEDADEGADKHRDKRARASYSDDNEASEDDDKDPWMDVDEEEDPEHPTEQAGTNQRRKSVVQDPKRKQDVGQVRESKPVVRPPRNVANTPIEQISTDGPNYAEMFLHSDLPSDDRERITTLQSKLIQAVGMLEDSQRKINVLDGIVRQRSEDVRQRVVRALKDEVNSTLDRFH